MVSAIGRGSYFSCSNADLAIRRKTKTRAQTPCANYASRNSSSTSLSANPVIDLPVLPKFSVRKIVHLKQQPLSLIHFGRTTIWSNACLQYAQTLPATFLSGSPLPRQALTSFSLVLQAKPATQSERSVSDATKRLPCMSRFGVLRPKRSSNVG